METSEVLARPDAPPSSILTPAVVCGEGFVRLESYMATDMSVVRAAKISFGQDVTEMGPHEIGVLRYMMQRHHGTPFEHNAFTFHVKCPIFISREWFRHRAGWSYNEFSTRYKEMPAGMFHVPEEDMRTQVGKPGAYRFEQIADPTVRAEITAR